MPPDQVELNIWNILFLAADKVEGIAPSLTKSCIDPIGAKKTGKLSLLSNNENEL